MLVLNKILKPGMVLDFHTQVILESRAQCEAAYKYVAHIRAAFPEVLRALKTKQLALEMLLYKEEYLADLSRTGGGFVHDFQGLKFFGSSA